MKRILAILMFAAVFGLVMGTVAASIDLESHDFDSNFQMKVPKNSTFNKTDTNGLFHTGFLETGVSYYDPVNKINITYANDNGVNDSFVDETVNKMKDAGGELSKKGDINQIKSSAINIVIFHKGNEMIMMASTTIDSDTLTSMAESAEF